MLVKQSSGVEVVDMSIYVLFAEKDAAATLNADWIASGQTRVTVGHGPAQKALAFGNLLALMKIKLQIIDIAIQLFEIGLHGLDSLYVMQGISKMNFLGINLSHAMQAGLVQAREYLREALRKISVHVCAPRVLKTLIARLRVSPRSTMGRG
jgi:hypothetical protein